MKALKNEKKVINSSVADFKASVYMSDDFLKQLYITHLKVPRGIEWCGILLYEVLEGSLSDMENFSFKLLGYYPIDIGSAAYTSADISEHLADMYDAFPQLLESGIDGNPIVKTGFIHSHHTMDVYFSTTDKEELLENCRFYNYYLSVIVNYRGDVAAKIAIPTVESVEKKVIKKIKNDLGDDIIINHTEEEEIESVLEIDCLIYYYKQNNEIINAQLDKLVDNYNNKKEETKKAYNYPKKHSYGKQYQFDYFNSYLQYDKKDLTVYTSDKVLDVIVAKLVTQDTKNTKQYNQIKEKERKKINKLSYDASATMAEKVYEFTIHNIETILNIDKGISEYIQRLNNLITYARKLIEEKDSTLIESVMLDALEDAKWEVVRV